MTDTRKPEFTKGLTDQKVADHGTVYEAGIHHHSYRRDSKGPEMIWWQRVICYGNSQEEAESLRDRILEALEAPDPSTAAIQFALSLFDEGHVVDFLRSWNEGDFDYCRMEYPGAPDEAYLGADPLLKPKRKA